MSFVGVQFGRQKAPRARAWLVVKMDDGKDESHDNNFILAICLHSTMEQADRCKDR